MELQLSKEEKTIHSEAYRLAVKKFADQMGGGHAVIAQLIDEFENHGYWTDFSIVALGSKAAKVILDDIQGWLDFQGDVFGYRLKQDKFTKGQLTDLSRQFNDAMKQLVRARHLLDKLASDQDVDFGTSELRMQVYGMVDDLTEFEVYGTVGQQQTDDVP